jgi:copper transport protein
MATCRSVGRRGQVARRLVVAVLAGAAVLVVTPTPADAHAELISSEPAADEQLDVAPEGVVLRFTESVEVEEDGVAVYASSGDAVDAASPEHPDGDGSSVAVDLPELDDGAYLVSWRVLSSDSHPVSGAFTFLVGDTATAADAVALMDDLAAGAEGDRLLGVVYGVARFAAFVGMVVVVGGAAFVLALWPAGMTDPRTRRLLAAGWGLVVVTTVASIGLQGAYGAGLSLGDVVDPAVISDALGARIGRVWLVRLVLLVLVALLGTVYARRAAGVAVDEAALADGRTATDRSDATDDRTPAANGAGRAPDEVLFVAAVLGVALLATVSLAGHAVAGDLVPMAVVTDVVHLGAISLWLGGLVLLVGVLLHRRPAAAVAGTGAVGLERVVDRFSSVAFGAVVVIVASGTLQGWRQVRSLEALTDTSYGRLLLTKIGLFTVMIGAAAVSRAWVRGRLAGSRASTASTENGVSQAEAHPRSKDKRRRREWTSATPPSQTVAAPAGPNFGVLRRSVAAEAAVAVVVLAVTAALVNAVPAETAVDGDGGGGGPFSAEIHGANVLVIATVDPAQVGVSEVDLQVAFHDGTPLDPEEATASLTLPERDLGPLDLPLERVETGRYVSDNAEIPFPGDWELEVVVRTSDIDQDRLAIPFTVG